MTKTDRKNLAATLSNFEMETFDLGVYETAGNRAMALASKQGMRDCEYRFWLKVSNVNAKLPDRGKGP